MAERLTQNLGFIMVDNRPGAGGTIGSRIAAAAEPDGYTLLFGSSTTLAAAPALYPSIGYEPSKSFTPVAMIASVPFALVVAPSLPVHSVAELVAYAKAHPGKLNYGAPTGALPHLTTEMFKALAAIDIVHVPYKGAATAITDLLARRVDLAFEPTSVLLAHIHAGELRALAVTSATRSPRELPTVADHDRERLSGLHVGLVERDRWRRAGTPPGTSSPRSTAAVNAGIAEPGTQARLTRMGAAPTAGTTRFFGLLIAAETLKWAAVVKAAHIRIE